MQYSSHMLVSAERTMVPSLARKTLPDGPSARSMPGPAETAVLVQPKPIWETPRVKSLLPTTDPTWQPQSAAAPTK